MARHPSFASRLGRVAPSATVAITDRARALAAEGVDVLSFSVGEPDFEPPEYVKDAASKAIRDGRASRYTHVSGILELREAVCEDSSIRRPGVTHHPEDVVISVGGKHSLFNLALALFEAGDEVLVPAPHWVSHPEQIRLAGADAVILETNADEGFKVGPEQIDEAITERTKGLILCSPSNPTGAAYTAAELEAIAQIVRERSIWVILDEIYGRLVYDGFPNRSFLSVAPDLRDRVIVVDGVSKSHAMTGYRIGWILAPREVAAACAKIQGQATTNPAAVSQYAALAALRASDDFVERMRFAFEARRDRLLEELEAIPSLRCRKPEGAFYLFPEVPALRRGRGLGHGIDDDVALCRHLLDEARCALVPGTAFGAPGHFRMSYAADTETLIEGIGRIGRALNALG